MKEKFIDDIFAYKKSAALLAALQMGIFEYICEKGMINLSICKEKNWNPEYLYILLEALSAYGYLVSEKQKEWYIKEEFKNQFTLAEGYRNLINHECNIFGNYISPELIRECIQSDSGNRPYDKEHFSKKQQKDYDKAVYERSSIVIGYQLYRKIRQNKNCKILEIGRTNSIYSDFLKKKNNNLKLDFIYDIEHLKDKYDVIVMTNTVHYYSDNKLVKILNHIYSHLSENGFLCIADMFIENDSCFNTTLYIDWLTHGGIHQIYLDNVLDEIEKLKYKNVEYIYLENISTFLVYAFK